VIGNHLNDSIIEPVFDSSIEVPKYQFGIYGIIIVLMMLFRPAGLIPERRRKLEVEEGVHDEVVKGEVSKG
jgi:ABC-type branched-subunit amino acid transport system permease subunit